MKIMRIISCIALVTLLQGCTIKPRITTTPVAGVEEIPTVIAVYPILANQAGFRPRYVKDAMTLSTREGRIYIVPPADTELLVTTHSEIFTGLVSSELSHYGFKLKALPLEVLDDDNVGSGDKRSFVVSLETIRHLRENYGLEALLIGNVFFIHDPYDPTEPAVRSFYLKLVDAETLDVLCHVSSDYGEYGGEMENAAGDIGFELAKLANLAEDKEDDEPYTQIKAD
jgi:hypothetical protein